jgi:hypothetical protein
MPKSTNIFKPQTVSYIQDNFSTVSRILDVGAGIGTYSNFLTPLGYSSIDAIEIFEPYVTDYHLHSKYSKVFNESVTTTTVNWADYDLIIFGDVLEHLSVQDSLQTLNKIPSTANVIIAVPFNAPQGVHYNNVYETHLQDTLTLTSFLELYTGYIPFCVKNDYGVFLTDNEVNRAQPIYTETPLADQEEVLRTTNRTIIPTY